MRIASVNVNGIRAAYRKGMGEWLVKRDIDILCLQEVRANDKVVNDFLAEDWHVHNSNSIIKGRAGVLIASKLPFLETRVGLEDPTFDESGRWVEADFDVEGKTLTVASVYLPSGEVGTRRQDEKKQFLDSMTKYLPKLQKQEYALAVGDLNVGHTELDIKNWRGNKKRSGFLPEERAYFDGFFNEQGWIDVGRTFHGEVPGPYTWWSNRGQAFTNDTGWRIDYHMANKALADKVKDYQIDRAASYEERWSDHAPVIVDYDL
ncbi:MAG: exodeoxyribonuclease III [Micrococcaceae bacterium]